jgi:pyrimidine operon attenuation protein/uracil phosphoribosyltransferase
MPDSAPILTKQDIAQRIERIAEAIRGKCSNAELALIGIHRRGIPLSERVYALLKPHCPSLHIGRVDISLYRDDLQSLEIMPKLVM